MAEQAIPLEVEAKLLVPGMAALRPIARLERIGPYPLRVRGAVRLHTTYLDTADLTLARHGLALRLRRQGRRWEATIKWSGRVDGDVHERPELTVPLGRPPAMPFEPPPGPLREQLAAFLCGRPLEPILVTEIHRRLFDVMPPTAAESAPEAAVPAAVPIAELALDRVRLTAPRPDGGEDGYAEVEIESRGGDRQDVAHLAELLRRDFELQASTQTKLARGLALFYPRTVFGGGEYRVRKADTVRAGARRVFGRHLERLRRHDPGTRAGTDVEALHDMRVATRRLRAAARVFAAGIPSRLQVRMRADLKWLAQVLGAVRDLDVQLGKLGGAVAAAPAGFRPEFDCLREHLQGERARHRAELLAAVESERYFGLLRRIERFAGGRSRPRPQETGAREPLAAAGRRAVRKAFRRLVEAGESVGPLPRPEDLHALRLRAKRLRYLLEFLADLTGKPGRRLVRRLTGLQDVLGGYHDSVVAADFVRAYVDAAGNRLAPSQLVAVSALVAADLRGAEQARAEFDKAWRRFARRRTAADCRAVLRKLNKLGGRCETPAGETPPESSDVPAEAGMATGPAAPEEEAK